jgi:hypothetical protein
MFYGGESNVPGAPGNLLAGGIPLRQLFPGAPSDVPFTPGMPGIVRPGTKQKLKDIFPHSPGGYGGEGGGPRYGTTPGGIAGNFPGTPIAFGSSNLPGAVGNMGGIANAQFFEGPQLGQAGPEQPSQKPYGGAPNVPLTPEEKARLLQQGTPPPANFREQYMPKAGLPTGFQSKFVS